MRAADIEIGQEYVISRSQDWQRDVWGKQRVRVDEAPVRGWARWSYGATKLDLDGNPYPKNQGPRNHALVTILDKDGNPQEGSRGPRTQRVPLTQIKETWEQHLQREADLKEQKGRDKLRKERNRTIADANAQYVEDELADLLALHGLEVGYFSTLGHEPDIRLRPVAAERQGLDAPEQQRLVLDKLRELL